jgi:hypothetical protein
VQFYLLTTLLAIPGVVLFAILMRREAPLSDSAGANPS